MNSTKDKQIAVSSGLHAQLGIYAISQGITRKEATERAIKSLLESNQSAQSA